MVKAHGKGIHKGTVLFFRQSSKGLAEWLNLTTPRRPDTGGRQQTFRAGTKQAERSTRSDVRKTRCLSAVLWDFREVPFLDITLQRR